MRDASVGLRRGLLSSRTGAPIWAASIALAAGWATYRGTLPEFGRPLLGPLIEGAAWAGLLAGLWLVYSAPALTGPESPRHLLHKLGLCLLLAIFSTHLCRLLSATLVAPDTWGKLFYMKRLAPPLFVGLWCAALLPRQTRALVCAARGRPDITPLPHLVVLLFSAAILVSCADLAFEWSGSSAVGTWLQGEVVSRNAWAANVLILFGAYGVAFALGSRVSTALLVISPPYVAWCLATLLKIRYMHSAIQPLDLVRIREFLPFAPDTWAHGASPQHWVVQGSGLARLGSHGTSSGAPSRAAAAGLSACSLWHSCWPFRPRTSRQHGYRGSMHFWCSSKVSIATGNFERWPGRAASCCRSCRSCRPCSRPGRPITHRQP